MANLIWRGDNIGLRNDDGAFVVLEDADGKQCTISVEGALNNARVIDPYGLRRIVEALQWSAVDGSLTPRDLAAWLAVSACGSEGAALSEAMEVRHG
ncbi:hypothetical protein [Burkholderia sp. Bp9099]|uniref:hypothetical protein n=1 Tax=Burkholderia sp. Bp9099 TaxID=2184568 RepID=UPI000F5DF10E|nr:hypothetical protein [Burkholderia sp. Bp9099]RQZ40062.1 hypothetical protein DIE17_33235 [Burkholderia sp. Bp9099]